MDFERDNSRNSRRYDDRRESFSRRDRSRERSRERDRSSRDGNEKFSRVSDRSEKYSADRLNPNSSSSYDSRNNRKASPYNDRSRGRDSYSHKSDSKPRDRERNSTRDMPSSSSFASSSNRLQAFSKLISKERITSDATGSNSTIIEANDSIYMKPTAHTQAGVIVKDQFSRGIKADVISDRYVLHKHHRVAASITYHICSYNTTSTLLSSYRERPYHCTECNNSFMMATQLSDHLRLSHSIHKHASMIKPSQPRRLSIKEDCSDNESESD